MPASSDGRLTGVVVTARLARLSREQRGVRLVEQAALPMPAKYLAAPDDPSAPGTLAAPTGPRRSGWRTRQPSCSPAAILWRAPLPARAVRPLPRGAKGRWGLLAAGLLGPCPGGLLKPLQLLRVQLMQTAEQFPGSLFELPYRREVAFGMSVCHDASSWERAEPSPPLCGGALPGMLASASPRSQCYQSITAGPNVLYQRSSAKAA